MESACRTLRLRTLGPCFLTLQIRLWKQLNKPQSTQLRKFTLSDSTDSGKKMVSVATLRIFTFQRCTSRFHWRVMLSQLHNSSSSHKLPQCQRRHNSGPLYQKSGQGQSQPPNVESTQSRSSDRGNIQLSKPASPSPVVSYVFTFASKSQTNQLH